MNTQELRNAFQTVFGAEADHTFFLTRSDQSDW